MLVSDSLWGEDFNLPNQEEKTKAVLNKINHSNSLVKTPIEKIVKSTEVPFDEKLLVTSKNVYDKLGVYKDDTVCIYSKEDLHQYITESIKNGLISIDTETLGTRTDIEKPATDPFTCKICGLCLYTPRQKNAACNWRDL